MRAVPSLSNAPVTVRFIVGPESLASAFLKVPALNGCVRIWFADDAADAADAATAAIGVVGITEAVIGASAAGLKPDGSDADGTDVPLVEVGADALDPILPMLPMSGPGLMRLMPRMTALIPSIAVLIIPLSAPKTLEIRFKTVLAIVPATLKAAPIIVPMIGADAFMTSKKA